MVYKRVGDIGIIILIFIRVSYFGCWGLLDVSFFKKKSLTNTAFLILCLFAAAGKSAQFGFHPWLPAAMEGPTPVSALLHRSTMVVAGVFLLVRVSRVFEKNTFFLQCCLILGGLTRLFASTRACFQFDFKKIVAYSTTSQLGLMVGRIGLGRPILAFFHICTHAFFKALLFLCSGRVIHRYNNEQDIRGLGNLRKTIPVTFSCFLIRSVSLSGIPFFRGFYSKDRILESLSGSCFNSLGVLLLGLSTIFTAIYRSRLVFYCGGGGRSRRLTPIREEKTNLLSSMVRLLVGVFLFGFLFRTVLTIPTIISSLFIKVSPLLLCLAGGIYGWSLGVPNLIYINRFFFLSNH